MIITESLFEEPLNVLTETTNGKNRLFIEGTFISCERKNKNSRVYPKAVIAEALEDFQEKVCNGQAWGTLGHDDSAQLDMAKVSHRIVALDWDKKNPNNVVGRAVVLDEGAGKVLSSILRSGGKIGVSTRGLGKTKKDKKSGNLIVESPFKLLSIDAVLDPSTNEMVKTVLESCGEDPEVGFEILTEMFSESATFDKAFAEYKARRAVDEIEPLRLKSRRSNLVKPKSPKSNIDALSGWLRKNGNRDLANLLSKPTETLMKAAHLHGLYKMLKKAHTTASHPHKRFAEAPIDIAPEVDDEFEQSRSGKTLGKSRFWEYRIELAKQEMERRRRNSNFENKQHR